MKSALPGKYIQGKGLIADIPELIKSFGKKGLIISSAQLRNLSDHLSEYSVNDIYIEEFNGECRQKEIKLLYDIVTGNSINLVAGIGGGKAIDTAKIVADCAGVPVIIVPT